MSIEVPIIILVLAIPTYFLSKWGLRKIKFGNDKNRKIIALIPTLFLSPIIYIGIVYLWIFSISYYPSNEFSKQEWETNIEERYRMSEDIIESKMLIGKNRDEVINILGNNYSTNNENRLSYELGFVPGLFNIDPDYLDIKFENEIVISVNQYEG